jgi:hypothetical protein
MSEAHDHLPADGAATPELAGEPSNGASALSLQTADGRDLRVSFAVDPVMDLKAWAMAGHRIESRLVERTTGEELTVPGRRSLLSRDFESIDLAALERGLSRVEGVEAFDRPRLIIQLSFISLSNGRARAAILERAREMQHLLHHAAICELVDVEAGVPVGRLSDVTSLVRTFFRSVWVQVAPGRVAVDTACAGKASGLTIRAEDLGEEPAHIAEGMRSFMTLMKKRNLLVTVTSLPSTDLMIDAMVAGFTHATLRAKRPADSQSAAREPALAN